MSEGIYRFTRQELYELVWSEPMVQLAKKFRLSDVALAKACRRLAIPVPERGYWARRQAGKATVRKLLPPRGPGMHDEVYVGGGYPRPHATTAELLGQELPPPPSFPEDIADGGARVRKMVGRVAIPKTLANAHPAIGRLLEEDERRREKRATQESGWRWDLPLFESPLERRRLRILNGIFLALARCGMEPTLRGGEGRDLRVRVGHTHVSFTLEKKQARSGSAGPGKGRPPREKLQFQIKAGPWAEASRKSWEDDDGVAIEQHVADIVSELIIAGEVQYRESALHHHQWLVERKAALEKQARLEKEEEERREQERQTQVQKKRVERLLNEALSLRRAADIRGYVEAVLAANASAGEPLPQEMMETWAAWARAEADRIDPIRSGRFLDTITGGCDGSLK